MNNKKKKAAIACIYPISQQYIKIKKNSYQAKQVTIDFKKKEKNSKVLDGAEWSWKVICMVYFLFSLHTSLKVNY